MQVRCFNTPLH
uniref:Uncharacterized protein n=1 Tax=Moniliophthora roreri TaxID=221103 RepID=A0A0W0FXH4_MONRR